MLHCRSVGTTSLVLTAPEVARVVSRLEPRSRVTDFQVRHLATVRCVLPSAHEPTASGDSALYTAADVALIRLILRLMDEGARPWMARAAVAQHAEALRAALSSHRAAVFMATGPLGVLNPTDRPTSGPAWCVRLGDVRRGLFSEIQRERRGQRVWARWGARTAAEAAQLIEATA